MANINNQNDKSSFLSMILKKFTSKQSDSAPNTSKSLLWANGTCAILTKLREEDPTIFGGSEKNNESKEICLETLEHWWGITSTAELDDMIRRLIDGMHNPLFISDFHNGSHYKIARKSLDESAAHTSLYINTYEKFGNNAIYAWDLSRAVSLCGLGYVAGYYSYDTATSKAIEISKKIQKTFESWDTFFESYMCGYAYWSDVEILDKESEYNTRLAIIENYKKDHSSFYYLDWNLNLDANK